MQPNDILQQLIAMSRRLGDPTNDYVILGEGNTSARADEETFWVKASGVYLPSIEGSGFVHVRCEPVLAMLDGPDLSDEEVKQELSAAKVGAQVQERPSVETVLHALALGLPDINFAGHTHPTAINALTCSVGFEEAVSGRLFPDEVVICGPAPAIVPYTDPGLPLARKVREVIARYLQDHGEPPKVTLMQNHGLFALGRTAQEVENITAMAVKTARILLGTYALGGPHFMNLEAVERIHTRPDELYRRKRQE